jgi:hypothetical protein
MAMEINAMLVDIFELEAVVGLVLLAAVIWALVHAFLDESSPHRFPSNHGTHR